MSRIRIVKGKITEIIGGDYKVYSASDIIYNAANEITQKGLKKGISYGSPAPPPAPLTIAKCVVYFRPGKDWKGEFGFDWIRLADSKLAVDNHYKDIIGQYGEDDTPKSSVFMSSVSKYEECLAEFEFFHSTKGKYQVPKITLQEGEEAVLDAFIDVIERPDKLHYAYDEELIELTILKKLRTTKGNHYTEKCLKIKCLKALDSDQSIRIIASMGKRMKKVGEINLQKNNSILSTKVLIIPVDYRDRKGYSKGDEEKQNIVRAFGQAFIHASTEEYSSRFPVGDDSSDSFFTTKNSKGETVMKLSPRKSLHRYLDELFMSMDEGANKKYAAYYRVYCLPDSLNLNGVAEGIGKGSKVVIVFQNRDNMTTMTHELLHAAGLYHTFDNKAKHTFKLQMTDNIMDYTHQIRKARFSTTSWQWKTLRENRGL